MEQEQQGGCLCGGVRFLTVGKLREVIACHCSQCRRQTGLHYAATDVALEDLRLLEAATLAWYSASNTARRGFCSRCGSALFWQQNGSKQISIMAGAFDQPSGLRMGCHIYCEDKGDFYELPTDDLPRYPKGRVV